MFRRIPDRVVLACVCLEIEAAPSKNAVRVVALGTAPWVSVVKRIYHLEDFGPIPYRERDMRRSFQFGLLSERPISQRLPLEVEVEACWFAVCP